MKLFTYFIAIFITSLAFSQNNSGKLIILHTNDLHSNLTGFSPELEYTPCITGDDNTRAGFSRIAALIKMERASNPDNVLVLDAGDYLMGTLFHVLEIEDGFQLNLMKKMGYDIVSVGNHEFDFGPRAFAKIINKNLEKGEIPEITFANVEFSKKSNLDDEFEYLFEKEIIRPYTIIKKGNLKIGVFGILGEDATDVAPNSKPLKITNRFKISKRIVKILREKEKVDFVICLSHSGVVKDKNGNWTGEDLDLARKVKGIDLIISGHTHTEIFDPIIIGNTTIVQTGSQGKYLGRYEVNIFNGGIKSSKYQLIPVDDNILGDCKIHQEIANRIRTIDDSLLRPFNLGYFRPLAETDFNLVIDELGVLDSSNLGLLVSDAILYYINNFSTVKTDISLVAAGVIRDQIRQGNKGIQTAVDIFRVMSLGEGDDNIPGYPLAQVYLTANEIKNLLEILIVAPKLRPSYYCFFSGIKVFYDGNKSMLKKIYKIEINGEEINFSKKNKTLYSLSANSYMLEFVGKVRGMTFGLVKIIPKNSEGQKITNNKDTWIDFDVEKSGIQEGKEWFALVKYLQSFPDLNSNRLPDIPENYKHAQLNIINTSIK